MGLGASVATDRARQDQLQLPALRVLLEGLGQMVPQPAGHEVAVSLQGQEEAPLDPRPLGALADHGRLGAAPEQELERIDDEALPRAGLPRDRVEATTEFERRALEEREVLETEFDEHARGRSHGTRRGCNRRSLDPSGPEGLPGPLDGSVALGADGGSGVAGTVPALPSPSAACDRGCGAGGMTRSRNRFTVPP